MNIKNLLVKILLAAAPVVAGVIAGPGAGAVVAAVMGAAGLTKKAGKKVEENGVNVAGVQIVKPGRRVHKVTTPAVAVGLPFLLAPLIPAEVMDQIRGAACQVCDEPMAIMGIALIAWHQIVSGLKKLGGQPEK